MAKKRKTKKASIEKASIKKSDDITELEAIAQAMEKLDTFEGNLKADHTETHYVFTKVRE